MGKAKENPKEHLSAITLKSKRILEGSKGVLLEDDEKVIEGDDGEEVEGKGEDSKESDV